MIRHVFSWQVAEGHSNDEIIEILNTLPGALPVIKYWEVGAHQGDPGDNGAPFDGVLITDFDTWEDLETYSNEPFHLDVVERLLPRFAARAVVDFERKDA